MTMVFKRRDLPEIGELVIAKIKKVFEYGAYVDLIEFDNLEAFIPWSEVSTKYVRDIRDVLKEGQITVAKVIRVDKRKRPPQIDLSIKRVTEGERRVRMMRWKRDQKAQKIVELTAKKLGKSIEEAHEYVWNKLKEKFLDVMTILEEAVIKGPEIFIEIGIPEDWAKALYEEAKKHIEIKRIRLRGLLEVKTLKSDGVERIKRLLLELENTQPPDKFTSLKIYLVGSPRYQVEIESTDYKIAERYFNELISKAEELAKKLGIEYINFKTQEVTKA